MKYLIILIVVFLGVILFVNKDKVINADNPALVIKSLRYKKTSTSTSTPVKDYIERGDVASASGSGSTGNCTLTVTKSGTGLGIVSPLGVKSYKCGTTVTITAKATDPMSYVGVWGGDCRNALNSKTCTLKLDKSKAAIAKINTRTVIKDRNKCTQISKDEYIENVMNSTHLTPEEKQQRLKNILDVNQQTFKWCWYWSF